MARQFPEPVWGRMAVDPKRDMPRRDIFEARIENIPEVLLENGTAEVLPDGLLLQTEQGPKLSSFGKLISYKGEARTPTGWACKVERDAKRRFEVVEGLIYPKHPIVQLELLTSRLPIIMVGGNCRKRSGGGATWKEGHFHQEAASREAVVVRTGTWEGVPTGYLLMVGTPAFHQMNVCDEFGEELCSLAKWYKENRSLVPAEADAA